MVFPSVPVYLDPPNWQQQLNHQQVDNSENPELPPLPTPLDHHVGSGGAGSIRAGSMADRARLAKAPQPEAPLKCPRCESTNTKFCYFNNYSLTQPRHFCKTCRRYWTRGGALRNVPVGGGCRRNKKKKTSSSTSSSKATAFSERQSGPNSTNAVIPSEISAHLLLETPHLPFMASLQSFSQYGIGNIGSNFGGFQDQIGPTSVASGQADRGFQIGTNSDISNAILSVRSGNHHQFPFFEPNNGLYPLQCEYMEASPSMVVGESQLLRSTNSSSRVSQRAPVKVENSNQGLNLSRSLMGVLDQNNQYWGGGNSWTDLSGLK